MPQYTLTRTLPDGTVKTNPIRMKTLREVEFAVAYCLMDNSRVPRGEARTFAAGLRGRPLGTTVKHGASGYSFRVDRTDRVCIPEQMAEQGLSLGDLVEFDARTADFPDGPRTVPGGRGQVRDVWAHGDQICARVELEGGGSDTPLLADLRKA